MDPDPPSPRLRLLPVQLIETNNGVILKRGRVEMKIDGDRAAEVVQVMLGAVPDGGATAGEVCALFAEPDRPAIADLVQQLVVRRILVPIREDEPKVDTPESSLEVFYWHFGMRPDQVKERWCDRKFTIIGLNSISRQLAVSLAASGKHDIEIVDYPLLRNQGLFDEGGAFQSTQWPDYLKPHVPYETWLSDLPHKTLDCLIATSDFGGQQLMREWNRFCLDHKCNFMPVVLQDLTGYVGPLIVPGETACYECLRARQNSNMSDPKTQRAAEYVAFEGQEVTGFHPSMASVLGDIAAIELMKFYCLGAPLWRVGILIEVNLLATQLNSRKVLKLPRCNACSDLNTQSQTSLTKSFLPSSQTGVR